MPSIEPNWDLLILFAFAWAALCSGAILLAGMLPLQAAPESIKSTAGVVLIALNAVLLCVVLIGALFLAYHGLRLTSTIVAAGITFLLAPFLIQDLPIWLKEQKGGLVALSFLLIVVIMLLWAANTTQFRS